jgi:hypothetical protein
MKTLSKWLEDYSFLITAIILGACVLEIIFIFGG